MSVYHPGDPYGEVICDPCPRCKAEPGDKCVNPETRKPAHAPCVVRCRKSVNA